MIDGVIIKNLITHIDDRGFFREIFHFKTEFLGHSIGQISHSLVKDNVIKAWHGHKEQSQWNYVVIGEIKVALYDNREHSKTFREIMEFTIGDGEPKRAYYFPHGVLHGYRCIKAPMHIIYVTSGVYDLDDEIRIAYDDPYIAYNWVT
jgi:dTDP-4-dehydrorhamnose 3,5-epimerase